MVTSDENKARILLLITHCIKIIMFQRKYFPVFLTARSSQVKHAALSALRNLSICESAKVQIRAHLPTLLTYATCDMPMLVFKALGCVRCLTRGNGEIAMELAGNTAVIKVLFKCN